MDPSFGGVDFEQAARQADTASTNAMRVTLSTNSIEARGQPLF